MVPRRVRGRSAFHCRSRSAGNRITSRIASCPVKIIASRSMPRPEPAGRRHPVRERLDVVGVALLRLDVPACALVGLQREPRRLLLGVVQLAEGVAQLDPAGEELEALDHRRIVIGRARERRELDRVVVEDRRLHEPRLDEMAVRMVDQLRPRLVGGRVDAPLVQPRAQLVGVPRPEAVLLERLDEAESPPGSLQVELLAAESDGRGARTSTAARSTRFSIRTIVSR